MDELVAGYSLRIGRDIRQRGVVPRFRLPPAREPRWPARLVRPLSAAALRRGNNFGASIEFADDLGQRSVNGVRVVAKLHQIQAPLSALYIADKGLRSLQSRRQAFLRQPCRQSILAQQVQ